jgi:hypothetical protein
MFKTTLNFKQRCKAHVPEGTPQLLSPDRLGFADLRPGRSLDESGCCARIQADGIRERCSARSRAAARERAAPSESAG